MKFLIGKATIPGLMLALLLLLACKSRPVESKSQAEPRAEEKTQEPSPRKERPIDYCRPLEVKRVEAEVFPFSKADSIEVLTFIPHVKRNYDTPKEEWSRLSSIKDGVFDVGYIQERVQLNTASRAQLFDLLFNQVSADPTLVIYTHCYNPHQVIVFYKEGKAIDFFEVCFHCLNYESHVTELDFCAEKWDDLRAFFRGLGLKYGLEEK